MLGGTADAGWWLADWYPIMAGWEADDGWYLDSPTPYGDPTFADAATYRLSFEAPSDLLVLGSGATTSTAPGLAAGNATTTIDTAPGRDLTLVLLPNGTPDLVAVTGAQADGFAVRISVPSALAVPGLLEAIAGTTGEMLAMLEPWLGEYPDTELDITTASLGGPGAVSWHGIIWLDVGDVVEDGVLSDAERDRLRFTLTHELVHQWIAGVVGSNNNDHGFMSEGLANLLAVLAIRETDGPEAAEGYLRGISRGYLALLDGGIDGVADAPLTASTDIGTRSQLVYGKAALGFEAIRQEIGNAAFLAGLSAYAGDFRFLVSEPHDLQRALEDGSGTDLGDLWQHWFLDADMTVAEANRLLDGFRET